MKTDERDEALGRTLDRALDTVPGPGSLPPLTDVTRRGARRRITAGVASVMVVVLFVGAVGFAASQVGRDGREQLGADGTWGTLAAPDIPWTMPVPPGWRAGAYRFVGGPRFILRDSRMSFVTNTPSVRPRGPRRYGGPFGEARMPGAVVVMVDTGVGQGDSRPTTLAFNKDHEIRGAPGWLSRDGKICGGSGCVRVYVEFGPDASPDDVALGERVARGVRPQVSPPRRPRSNRGSVISAVPSSARASRSGIPPAGSRPMPR